MKTPANVDIDVDVQENASFVNAFGYMFELTVSYRLVHYSYI